VLRFKHFSGTGEALQTAVNDWLSENEPDVTQMTQTVDGNGHVVLSFLFEESFRGQELRLSSERTKSRGGQQPAPLAGTLDDPIKVEVPAVSTGDRPDV